MSSNTTPQNSLSLKPVSSIQGHVHLPGSKSLSNRALLMAALADGTTEIKNLLASEDTEHMLNALGLLGIKYQLNEDKTHCTMTGNAGPINFDKPLELFLGNAGTAMRPLCAALAAGSGEFVLGGEPRMEERPIGPLVDTLRQAGASITYLKNPDYPPVKIIGTGLSGGKLTIDGNLSSQFLTAALMTSPLANTDSEILVQGELTSKPYIDITINAMQAFGVHVENHDHKVFNIKGNQQYKAPSTFLVEGDASSASYFLAAAAIKGGEIKVSGIGRNSVQGDIEFARVLEKMGAEVEYADDYIAVKGSELKAVDLDLNHIPDAAMTIATLALFAKGTTCIRNIYNWRVKETDRLAAMATELRKVGAHVVENESSIEITPPEEIQHACIDTYNDHRIAMCFSLLSLSKNSVTINDPSCVNKTFPNYLVRLPRFANTLEKVRS